MLRVTSMNIPAELIPLKPTEVLLSMIKTLKLLHSTYFIRCGVLHFEIPRGVAFVGYNLRLKAEEKVSKRSRTQRF